MKNKNKKKKAVKITRGWIEDLTDYEQSIFINMLTEANIVKRKELAKKERQVIMGKCRSIIQAIRKANKIAENKENIVPEQKTVNEVDVAISDVIKVKKERTPRVRNMDNYGRLRRVSVSEKIFLDNAVYEATRVKGRKLTAEERRKVLSVAREQIFSQRKANQIRSVRNKKRHAETFEWKKPEPFRR